MRKIASLVLAGVMAMGTTVAVATPSNAHVTRCETSVGAPQRVGSTNRILAVTSTKRPVDGHQTKCGMKATLQVWSYGSGGWRDIGTADADYSTFRRATSVPSTSLLFGVNYYRTKVDFWAEGNQGPREYTRTSVSRPFNRIFPYRRR